MTARTPTCLHIWHKYFMVTWKKEKSAFVRLLLPPRPTQIGKVCDIFVYEKIFCHVTMCLRTAGIHTKNRMAWASHVYVEFFIVKRFKNEPFNSFISVFNQLDAQNLFHNKFYFMSLHVSCKCAHHQEVTYRCDDTRGCVMQFWPSDVEHMCSKHVEAWNKTYCETNFVHQVG